MPALDWQLGSEKASLSGGRYVQQVSLGAQYRLAVSGKCGALHAHARKVSYRVSAVRYADKELKKKGITLDSDLRTLNYIAYCPSRILGVT
jgi:hypothetical protein